MKQDYNAIWVSNSLWYYMLDNPSIVVNPKSISVNPVVFGITKSKAIELGFVDKEIYTKDILNAIKNKRLKFVITSPIRTNTGATAYFGFLSTLLNNPEVITSEMLLDKNLKEDIKSLFSGVNRVSGSEEFLEGMFLSGQYEAVVSYETSLININKKLEKANKEPLYLVYPIDGVAMNDSSFGYINGEDDQSNKFKLIQQYLLSEEFQEELIKTGRRVWYGGVNKDAPKDIFRSDWGIDTTKYLNAVKYPSKAVIREALELYQTELRKPSHTIFVLDYSGSMFGNGKDELVKAMEYILTRERARENLLQFSARDKITIIPFSSDTLGIWIVPNGIDTKEVLYKIRIQDPEGGTNIYDPVVEAFKILEKEDKNLYNTTVILMTDGEANYGSLDSVRIKYNSLKDKIPVYSIMFGYAKDTELEAIARLTNGRVFDGRTNLLEAFKEVRGYE